MGLMGASKGASGATSAAGSRAPRQVDGDDLRTNLVAGGTSENGVGIDGQGHGASPSPLPPLGAGRACSAVLPATSRRVPRRGRGRPQEGAVGLLSAGAGGIFVLRSRAPCPGLGQEVELLGLEEKHRNTQERKPKEIEFVWLPASWISLKAERAR